MPVGPWELLIILAVVLLLFGGSRLAGLGKGVGRSIREFKTEVKAVDPVKDENETEVVDAEIVQTSPTPAPQDRVAELEAREREIAAREEELRRQREAETGR